MSHPTPSSLATTSRGVSPEHRIRDIGVFVQSVWEGGLAVGNLWACDGYVDLFELIQTLKENSKIDIDRLDALDTWLNEKTI